MDPIELATLVAFHQSHNQKASTAEQAGWTSNEAQLLRFSVLEQLGDWNGKSILDMGCGFGDFLKYITPRWEPSQYLGVDILPSFISQATENFAGDPQFRFVCGDYTQMDLPKAEFVVACGALSYPTSTAGHPYTAISRLWGLCTQGLAFNLLKASNSQPSDRYLLTFHSEEVLAYCKTLSPKVKLHDGYSEGDFTVFLYR
ncbi:MAG: methyltransferase domain-containing protein [Bacteroidota bacterium]